MLSRPGSQPSPLLIGCLLVMLGLLAYHNSFTGAFVFDDIPAIVENRYLRHPGIFWKELLLSRGATGIAGRPVLILSLLANFAVGGLQVFGYHAVNLAIHLLAGLLLFGVVKRTWALSGGANRNDPLASWLSCIIAAIWIVHPLHTSSVTYIIQRSESLMGLCYLLTLYSFIRGSQRGRHWLCVAACAAGMMVKPVMVTAPLSVLLYDGVFLSRSVGAALRQRMRLYVSLAFTWALPVVLFAWASRTPNPVSGFHMPDVTAWAYLRTQPEILLHYLRLAIWPSPLLLDYAWPVAHDLRDWLTPALAVALLGGLTVWSLRRHPRLGFLGAWFFLVLAPSSSLVPLADLAFEHRMYLPLSSVIILGVLGIRAGLSTLLPSSPGLRRTIAAGLAVLAIGGLSAATLRRNRDYASPITIWNDTLAQRPSNARAHASLAMALEQVGDIEKAWWHYREALRLQPNNAVTHNNLGLLLAQQGRDADALEQYQQAIRLKPGFLLAHYNLGNLLYEQGEVAGAIAAYETSLRIRPDAAQVHNNLANALMTQTRLEEAIRHYAEAVRLDPSFAAAESNWGVALERQHRLEEAVFHYHRALRLEPDDEEAHVNLANLLYQAGQLEQAASHYHEALRVNPHRIETLNNLGAVLGSMGRFREAAVYFRTVLALHPHDSRALRNLDLLEEQRARASVAPERSERQ